ncbi:amino acid ABC transporter substrate-binding protein [Pseudolabrys taiwanensis]|uniref:amino acid ABC transporter substrate-binding protein n=1 Tax=Pseudolabrys taiwanensis TaxID=331696 RepID=UPI001AED0DCC|nr:amino acid ABC transporter substrate-binding protein [Pseudolabrys taiwanensis]
MTMSRYLGPGVRRGLAGALLLGALLGGSAAAQDKTPIKIGFGMAQTGPLGPNGKSAMLAMEIWREEINAKGGLLGRPVEFVSYDDQSNPSTVPGIYTKLIDIDKVDIVMAGYATNMIAPAMPVVMRKKMVFPSLFGLGVNDNFKYDRHFSMSPAGPEPIPAFTKGFFDIALAQNPKPTTVALVAADAEFSKNACDGARLNAKAAKLKIVYDKSYPPSTTEFASIVRAIQATNPDLVVICSYPLDSVGLVQAVNEVNFKPKMIGGAMVGLQNTVFKTKLGDKLNGFVNFDFWLPAKSLMFPGVESFLKTYQERAAKAGVDPLGYYMGPFGYAYVQVIGQAIEGTQSLDQAKLAEYMHKTTFKTIVGDVKYGADGEWAKPRVLQAQFRGLKGTGLDQFRQAETLPIVAPAEYKAADVIYPYEKAKE